MSLTADQNNQTFNDLRYLYEHSDKTYIRTDSPDEAELILIALPGNDISFRHFAKSFLQLKLSPEHLDKAFAISLRRAKHIFLMRGVYESASKYGMGNSSRIKSGAFTEKAFNSLIELAPLPDAKNCLQKKKYLFSFIGRNCHPVREQIFNLVPDRTDILIEDSSDFDVWNDNKSKDFDERLLSYTKTIRSSKFSVCPRGYGASSIRLFESMKLGVCPVIISDQWKLPEGPDWKACSLIVSEKQVKNLEKLISKREDDYLKLGTNAAKMYNQYFSKKTHFNWIANTCLNSQQSQKIPERYWWKLRYVHYFMVITFFKAKKTWRLSYRIIKSIAYNLRKRLLNLFQLTNFG
jgi:hypothetical protein